MVVKTSHPATTCTETNKRLLAELTSPRLPSEVRLGQAGHPSNRMQQRSGGPAGTSLSAALPRCVSDRGNVPLCSRRVIVPHPLSGIGTTRGGGCGHTPAAQKISQRSASRHRLNPRVLSRSYRHAQGRLLSAERREGQVRLAGRGAPRFAERIRDELPRALGAGSSANSAANTWTRPAHTDPCSSAERGSARARISLPYRTVTFLDSVPSAVRTLTK